MKEHLMEAGLINGLMVAVLLSVGAASTLHANETERWITLFDGKSLEGWMSAGGGAHQGWVIEEGA